MVLPCDFGPYRLIGLLGEGGMSRVFAGHRLGPGGAHQAVALKVLKPDAPKLGQLLSTEAELASAVRHPNVVDVLDAGSIDGVPFIAMEHVGGLTLRQLLARAPLPQTAALDVLLQVASGLAALHEVPHEDGVGLVHRDLKPTNVLVDADGRVRLVDFGIAAKAGTVGGPLWGTLNYMSPEQALGERVTPASDVFVFGALMVEVLIRKRLWNLQTIDQAQIELLHPLERLHAVAEDVDQLLPGASDVLDGCLQADAADRWPNGRELWSVLDGLGNAAESDLADRVVPTPPSTPPGDSQTPTPVWGRDADRAWLKRHRAARVRTLVGPVGQGKRAIARDAARWESTVEVRATSMAGLTHLQGLKGLAKTLGLRHAEPAWVVGEALSGRPVLMVLEDVAHPKALGASAATWLKRAPGLRLLVTASAPLGVPGEEVRVVGEARNTRLDEAWSRLSPAMRRVLGACSLFGDFTLEDAIAVLEASGFQEPWAYLALLAERGLLQRQRGRLWLDEWLAQRARNAMDEDALGSVHEAHARRYAALGSDAAMAQRLGPRAAELRARTIAEQDNLVAALRWGLKHDVVVAERAARALYELVALGHDVPQLDLLSAPLKSPRVVLARAMARTTQSRDVEASALLEQVLDEADSPALRAAALTERARQQLGAGAYDQARELAREAVKLADRHNLRPWLVRALRVEAVLYRRQGRPKQALKLLQWCAKECRGLNDLHYLSRVNSVLGLIYMDLRRLDLAREALEASVAGVRDTADEMGLSSSLGNLALVERKTGNVVRAEELLREALACYRRLGRLTECKHTHGVLGAVYLVLGRHAESLEHFERSLELTEAVSGRDSLPWSLNDLGCVLSHLGRLDEANEHLQRARAVGEELGMARVAAVTDINLLTLMMLRGDLDDASALAAVMEGQPWFQRVGYRGALQLRRGELERRQGEPELALELLDASLENLHGMEHEMSMLAKLERAQTLVDLGRRDEAHAEAVEVRAWVDSQKLGPKAQTRLKLEHVQRRLER